MMKHAMLYIAALLVGIFSGYRSESPREDGNTPSGDPELGVITFTGHIRSDNAGQLFAENPGGSNYSRARLLELLQRANEFDDVSLLNAVLREWSHTETVDGVLALFESGHQKEGWQLLAAWAEHHPEPGAKIALSMDSSGHVEREYCGYILSSQFKHLLRTDPEKAVALKMRSRAEEFPINIFRPDEIAEWPLAAKRKALQALCGVETPYEKWRFAETFIRHGDIPPREGIAWIEEHLPLSRKESAYETALQPWIAEDAESAAEFVSSRMDGSMESRALLRTFIRNISGRDRGFLVDWMKRQDLELLKDAAPIDWVSQSPEDQRSLVDELGPGFEWLANTAIRNPFPPVFSGLPESDLPDTWPPHTTEEAGAWITQSVPTTGLGSAFWTVETMNDTLGLLVGNLENLQPSMAKDIANNWAKHDPHAAIEWAAQLPDHLMIETAEAAVADWFSSEPTAALEYVDEMDHGEFRSYAVARIAEEWFDRERETAIQWVNAMPLGFDRDIGKQLAAETFLYQNPKRSYLNANAIGNRVLREESLENTFRHWLRKEPQVAFEYLQQADMNDALRSSLKNLPETRNP